ncbi:pentapeptide repeat-containing protein [Paenisporosarcina sp. OV554]|uniref:pentapeptide repeat-containing protein n=1 Tax=Paenisporosarcina sp. OV554 TaxID=2135694 RepID=UPI000D33D000|nr:pentapeptide repeat-containing protein [Paenisporosarcina sp. OV554]PUB12506.1 pentapeptide repeat protein [Paenisporosarcina sp. OV554]
MGKIFSRTFKNELAVMISILVLLAIMTVVLTLSYDYIPIIIHKSIYQESSFWEGFLVNLHNSVFDFIFLGIMLYYFTDRINEKRKIEEYHDNIEDVRFWFREEATSKIIANITRLNKNGVIKINISKCYLKDAYLKDVKLINSKLMGAVLEGSNLHSALLNGSDFKGAKLENANLTGASLKEAKMRNIFCDETNFTGTNLTDTDLNKARLINSNFKSAILKGADLQGAEFDNSSFVKANFIGARNIDINSIVKAKTLVGSKFDSQIKVEIERVKPELFSHQR